MCWRRHTTWHGNIASSPRSAAPRSRCRARSGCGAALVGSADQVLSEIEAYRKMGIRAFIFSGYPHMDECDYFGRLVMPELKTCSLPHAYGRVPQSTPATPLGIGERR